MILMGDKKLVNRGNRIRILPSLASANQLRLEEQIEALRTYPYLHLDVEDGNFIPNITFGMKTIQAVAAVTQKKMDVHLMVTKPEYYIDDLLDIGIESIAFHMEAVSYPGQYLEQIHRKGGKAGIAFNFTANPRMILPYVDEVDYVLLMTSEPDGKGQEFHASILKKIEEARQILPEHIRIVADGGISKENMLSVVKSGADTLVMGRAVWNAADPGQQIDYLLSLLNKKREF